MNKNDSITLIVPSYNEETNIQKGVLDKIGNYTADDRRFSEVLIVDDGSTDKTRRIIKERYLNEFPKFRLIAAPHKGKAFAIIRGIQEAKGDYVMFTDIDLATPIEEAEKLIKEAEKGYLVVIGGRVSGRKGAPLTRKLLAYGFIHIRNMLFGLQKIRDTQCGFKLFETKAAREIISNLKVFNSGAEIAGPSVSAAFDLEFLFVASRLGIDIKEVPVTWRHVETKNVNFIRDSIETVRDLMKIKYAHSRFAR